MKKAIFCVLILAMLLLPSIVRASGPQVQCFNCDVFDSQYTCVCRMIDYDMGVICYMYAGSIYCVKIGG